MSAPKISVIIPVYNSGSFFARTLHRVLKQQDPAHEIIVINDGSTDDTQKILDGFRGKIITKTIPNSGCSAARNEGARLSSGELLAFLDADDLWFRKKLKVVSEYAQKYPEIQLFTSDYLVRSDFHGRIVRHYDCLPNRGDFNFNKPLRELPLKLLMVNNFLGTPSAVVVRKAFFERMGGFDPECKIVEDLDFFLRAAEKTNFVVIRDALFYKHVHEQSMSYEKIKTYEGHKRVLLQNARSQRAYILKNRLKTDSALSLAGVNYILGNLYFNSGKRKKAYLLFWEALVAALYPHNFLQFLWAVSKKTVRLVTGDRVNRENFRKAFRAGL